MMMQGRLHAMVRAVADSRDIRSEASMLQARLSRFRPSANVVAHVLAISALTFFALIVGGFAAPKVPRMQARMEMICAACDGGSALR
jgi:hypothetical protein